jgi:hypothetical protein
LHSVWGFPVNVLKGAQQDRRSLRLSRYAAPQEFATSAVQFKQFCNVSIFHLERQIVALARREKKVPSTRQQGACYVAQRSACRERIVSFEDEL